MGGGAGGGAGEGGAPGVMGTATGRLWGEGAGLYQRAGQSHTGVSRDTTER